MQDTVFWFLSYKVGWEKRHLPLESLHNLGEKNPVLSLLSANITLGLISLLKPFLKKKKVNLIIKVPLSCGSTSISFNALQFKIQKILGPRRWIKGEKTEVGYITPLHTYTLSLLKLFIESAL